MNTLTNSHSVRLLYKSFNKVVPILLSLLSHYQVRINDRSEIFRLCLVTKLDSPKAKDRPDINLRTVCSVYMETRSRADGTPEVFVHSWRASKIL